MQLKSKLTSPTGDKQVTKVLFLLCINQFEKPGVNVCQGFKAG